MKTPLAHVLQSFTIMVVIGLLLDANMALLDKDIPLGPRSLAHTRSNYRKVSWRVAAQCCLFMFPKISWT